MAKPLRIIETGRYSNRQIGEFVGLSYSSVSKRLSQAANSLKSENKDRTKKIYAHLSAKVKVCPPLAPPFFIDIEFCQSQSAGKTLSIHREAGKALT